MNQPPDTGNHLASYSYDAAGNMQTDGINGWTYVYDAENRITTAGGTAYTYDADGRRVQKSDGTLYWVDDSFEPLSVGTTSGITQDYIFLNGQRIAFVPLSSGNPYYYLSDHLGSDTVVASGDGKTIQWEADYFPFGTLRTVITNLVNNPYQFTGYEYDSGTGYNYAVARFEAGRWGSFQSPDPLLGSIDVTNPQSLNRYAYVANNPVSFADPLGLMRICTLTSGSPDETTFCITLFDLPDGQAGGDPFGPGTGGGGGGGWGGIIGGILNGGGSVPGTCFLPGACPSIPVPGISLPGLPGLPAPGCDFGACGNNLTPVAAGVGTVVCQILEPCGAVEDVIVGVIGLTSLVYLVHQFANRGQGDVGHDYVRAIARQMPGDYCSNLKAIQDQAKSSGDSKLFNDAKATYKADCRGKR